MHSNFCVHNKDIQKLLNIIYLEILLLSNLSILMSSCFQQGPFVHISSILATVLSKLVSSFKGIHEVIHLNFYHSVNLILLLERLKHVFDYRMNPEQMKC